ncbi:hypothetical protein JHK85_037410 [Glycine max]|nr:hypothetical protein JHK85_037410 [Glycine max]
MEKISPRFGKVARGDIVVLRNPQHPRHFMTKRVVGLEGDSLTRISSPDNSDKSKTIVVPKGAVWVEGDNKYNSNDSRKFGPVPYDLIDGKMLWRVRSKDEDDLNNKRDMAVVTALKKLVMLRECFQ